MTDKAARVTGSRGDTGDEVDRLLEAWHRERPDLDVTPMQVLSRVTRLARHLDQRRRGAFSTHDLEHWEFDVLAALRRAGQPYQLSPGQLLRETLVTSGTMTNRVDRLVHREYVVRENHPEDRRGVLVRLTAPGKQAIDETLSDLVAAEEEMLSDLQPSEREALAGLLRRLILPYEA